MKKPVVMLTERADEAGICKHSWLIDTPDGPLSNGFCKKCGKVQDFPAAMPEQTKSYRNYINTKFGNKKTLPLSEEIVECIPDKIESGE